MPNSNNALSPRMASVSSVRSLLGSRQSLGMADQVLASGNNFLATILIGKFAGETNLGTYALTFSALTVAIVLADALIAWPYTLRRLLTEREPHKFSGSVLLHLLLFGLGITCAAWLLAVALPDTQANASRTLMVFAVVAPACLLRHFARRFEFAHGNPRGAILVDGAVFFTQASGLFGLALLQRLDAISALMLIAALNGGVALLWLASRYREFRPSRELLTDWRENFVIGRWFIGSELVGIVGANVVFWLLALTDGVAATGTLTACFTIVLILNPVLSGFQNVFQPRCATLLAEQKTNQLRREVSRSVGFMLGGMAMFMLFMSATGAWLVAAIYGQPKLANYQLVITLLAAETAVMAIAIPVGCGLNAMKRTDFVFWAGMSRVMVTAAIAWPLMLRFGLLGAAGGVLSGAMVGSMVRFWGFYRVCFSARDEVTEFGFESEVA